MGLRVIGVSNSMFRWIDVCMSTTYFIVAINGELHDFFPSSRGQKQGDSFSLYLFVLDMKGLRGILRETSKKT